MRAMKRTPYFFILTTLACWFCTGAAAQTRYVSDQLEINLRSGQSNSHRILHLLKSGSPVEVLETDAASGYSKVRAGNGAEGWVLSRYLTSTPGAREELEKLQKKFAALETENRQLKERSGSLREQQKTISEQQKNLDDNNRRLEQELAQIRITAGSALALESDNKRLKEQYLGLQSELQILQQETRALKDRSDHEWFVRGAGVVVIGILIGLIVPRLKFRRRSSWDSL